MGIELKSYEAAKEYFTRAMNTYEMSEIILFHNQRDTVRKLLKEAAVLGKRAYIEKDLSTISPADLGGIANDNKIPVWMQPAMDAKEGCGVLIYLREFHAASDKIKDDVLNILVKKEVQSFKLPKHTLLVIGVETQDEAASGISHTHSVRFFR
jgi:hypothetical protein